MSLDVNLCINCSFLHLLNIVKYSHRVQKNSARGVQGGTGPPNLNLGPPKITDTTRARMLKLKTQLDIVKYSLWVEKNFSASGRPGCVEHTSVNLGPP